MLGVYFASDSVSNEDSFPTFLEAIIDGVTKIVTQAGSSQCLVLQIRNKLLSAKDKLFVEVGYGALPPKC